MRAVSLIASGLCAVALSASADIPTYPNEPSGQYFREWLVLGPFPLTEPGGSPDVIRQPGLYRDYLQPIGGEAAPQVVEGQSVTYEGGSATWKRYVSDNNEIDLDLAVSPQDLSVAYAYCEIQSAGPGTCVLLLGSNDGVRAWFNGEAVWDMPIARGLSFDQDAIPIVLRPGKNTLLLKVEDRGNKWLLSARLVPLDHGTLAERFRLFDVVTTDDGAAVLRVRQSAELLRTLVEKVSLKAVPDPLKPGGATWSGTWSGETETVIGVPADPYGEYVLQVELDLKEGARQTVDIPFTAGKRIEYVLFADGKTDYSIVVSPDASEADRWAAQELQHWLKEVSGADFAIVSDGAIPDGPRILLGRLAPATLAASSEPARTVPEQAPESFQYQNEGPDVLIYGGGERGTMYGVMSFLEREMGVRFYTPKVTVAPKRDKYSFYWLNHSEKPGIRVRNDFYYEAFDPIWAARNRINGAMNWREQPGGLECYWAVHTFFPLVPPEEFFATHPEYYSLIDGKRQAERAQLCLTNPDVLRIVTERIKRKMVELPDYLIYDVSQNDWANPCQCPDCQAIVDREGSQSGPVIWFVNQVADAVKAEFPDKFIGTLAYQYTRKPPKTLKPRENVVVRFCSIECCFAHDFLSCPENKSFVEDMNGWAAIASHIYIWDYVVNFSHYIMPYPNFRVLQPNIRFFRDHNAIGIMEQAAYQSRGGEFAELRAYVIAKLLWNPECDVPEVIDDFMHGYYGRAGQYVRAYFDLLHAQLTPDTHIHLGLTPDDKLFSDRFVRDAEALFDKAETVADNEEIRQRVEMARLPVMYLKCRREPLAAKRDGTYARFCAIVEREGITHYAEAGAPHRQAFHDFMESAE